MIYYFYLNFELLFVIFINDVKILIILIFIRVIFCLFLCDLVKNKCVLVFLRENSFYLWFDFCILFINFL